MVIICDQVSTQHTNECFCWPKVNFDFLITSVNPYLTYLLLANYMKFHVLKFNVCHFILITSSFFFLSSLFSVASLKSVRIFKIKYFVTNICFAILRQLHEVSCLKINLHHYIFLTFSSMFSNIVHVSSLTAIRVYLRRHHIFQFS